MLHVKNVKSYSKTIALCDVCNKRIAYKEHTKNKGKCNNCYGQTTL